MKKKYQERIIPCLLFAVYWVRILFLDADTKCFRLSEVQPIDEMYHSELAINIIRYGLKGVLDGTWSNLSIANAKTFLIPSLITSVFMKVFGYNFWGFKLSNAFIGFVTGVLLYKIIKIIVPGKRGIHWCVLAAYIFDFNVFMLSREAVTMIPCAFACLVLTCILLLVNRTSLKWFLAGFWCVLSFCAIYMGMPFFFIATIIILLISSIVEKEKFILNALFYSAGMGAGVLLCECLSRIFFQQHVIKTISDTMAAQNDKISDGGVLSLLIKSVDNIFDYWCSNAFRYNYLSLITSWFAICILIHGIIKYKDRVSLILVCIIISHWAQTIVLKNMTPSKSTITYPIIILAIGYAFFRYCYGDYQIDERTSKVLINLSYVLVLFGLFLFFKSSQPIEKKLLCIEYCVAIISAFGLIVFIGLRKRYLLISCVAMSCAFMAFLSFYYALYNPTYTDREMLIDLGKQTNNGMLINGTGLSLYNYCKSPANVYDHYKGAGYDYDTMWKSMVDACYEYDELYYVGYYEDNEWNVSRLMERLDNTGYSFEEIARYRRAYGAASQWDHTEDQILYKKVCRP